MTEQKFTEAEYTRAADDFTFCQLAAGAWVSENQSAKYGAMLRQAARAVAEVNDLVLRNAKLAASNGQLRADADTLQADNAKLRAGEAMIKALLNSYGVSDERMRGRVSNGIEVLMTRMTRMEVALRERADSATAEVTKLRAEVDGLRRDAERYRWLRVNQNNDDLFQLIGAGNVIASFLLGKEELDAVIDHALTSTGGDAK